MIRRAGLPPLAVVLAVAAAATADVRLVAANGARPAAVAVTPTASGIWSAVGPIDTSVLNPHGDRLGDGNPGWNITGDTLLVAWARPSSAEVIVSWARGDRWRSEAHLPARQSVAGTPRIEVSAGRALVAWQIHGDDGPVVEIVALQQRGDRLVALGRTEVEGTLVALEQVGKTVHLLVVDDRRILDVLFEPGPPIINPLSYVLIDVAVLGGGDVVTSSDPTRELLIAAAPRVEAVRASGEARSVLLWWIGARELAFLELSGAGPEWPSETLTAEHGPERPESLVREALRIVRERH